MADFPFGWQVATFPRLLSGNSCPLISFVIARMRTNSHIDYAEIKLFSCIFMQNNKKAVYLHCIKKYRLEFGNTNRL